MCSWNIHCWQEFKYFSLDHHVVTMFLSKVWRLFKDIFEDHSIYNIWNATWHRCTYLWYDFYSFCFLQIFLKLFLWNKIDVMPLTYIMTNQKDNICHVKSGCCLLCNFSNERESFFLSCIRSLVYFFPPSVIFAHYSPDCWCVWMCSYE
jgi:hypothetical protein